MDRPVLVIGSGMAGISACLHILAKCPKRKLSLISHHSPNAPSEDHSKIVRVDYANKERMLEAQMAQNCWKEGSFSPYYVQCGRVVAYDSGSPTLTSIDHNREQLGLPERERGNKDMLVKFFGLTNASDSLTFVHNPDDAAVNWQPCILKHENEIKEKCRQTGGSVYDTKVESLDHDEKGVMSVILSNGDSIDTRDMDIVLAVGPWTVEILEKSKIESPPEDRIPIPTGLFAFQLKLNDNQIEFFKNKPILSQIGQAEFVPPVQDNGKAKITWVEPFTISPIRDVSESALAYRVLDNALAWVRTMLPCLRGAMVTAISFYCDGVTATQAPLIAGHPAIKNLFLDCGGSYTRAKDLPTNGGYIASLLNGEKVPERVSWNGSSSANQDQPLLVARSDFKTLDEQARQVLGDRYPPTRTSPVAIV